MGLSGPPPMAAADDAAWKRTPTLSTPVGGGLGIKSGGATPTFARRSDETTPLLPLESVQPAPRKVRFADHPQVTTYEVEETQSPLGRAVWAVAIGTLHIGCSAGLILFNKYILAPHRFPHATVLTTIHMACAFVLASVLHACAPHLFPGFHALRASRKQGGETNAMWVFLPIGGCGALTILSGNAAYHYSSVSFLQMVKESVVLWVYLLTVFLGFETPRCRNFSVLGFVTVMAAMAVCGEVHFVLTGFLLQLLSSVTQASQAVLTSRLMTRANGPKVDPLSMVLGSAPVVLLMLLPINAMVWDRSMVTKMIDMWPMLAVNAVCAFGLQVVNAITIRELSATGLALAAIIKDVSIVVAATIVFNEHLANLQVVGFIGSVVGIAVYSAMKLNPHWFEAKAPPKSMV